MKDTNLIIDFDSTFVTIETLDELAQISIGDDQDSVELIKHITHKAMAGELDFCDALSRRIEVLSPVKKDIEKLIIDIESNKISPSFTMNKEFINTYRENIYIVSGGFREVINPIVSLFGIFSSGKEAFGIMLCSIMLCFSKASSSVTKSLHLLV